MILTGKHIISSVQSNDITITPFSSEHVSTNSYDISLGDKYIRYLDEVLDPLKENRYEENRIPDEGLILKRGDFILAESKEIIGSNKFVPLIHGKSGVARKGLFVHITADLVDLGYLGKITLQLYATQNIVIHREMKIAQVSFWVAQGEVTLYCGKYQHGSGPQASKIHFDYIKNQ
jgi:dCTP deaminase